MAMVKNLPVKTLAYKDLTIEGYSRAAVQTYWRIPEFKLGFDLAPSRGPSWARRPGLFRTRTWTTSSTCRSMLPGGG